MKHCATCTCSDLSDPGQDTVGGFRKTDPDTSAAAAYDVLPRSGTQRMRVLEHLIGCGEDGATDDETMTALSMEPSSAQTRRNELMKGGWVYDTGRTRPTHTGQDAIVWAVTPEGRARYHGEPEAAAVHVASTGRTVIRRCTRKLPTPVVRASAMPRSKPGSAQSKGTAVKPVKSARQEKLAAMSEVERAEFLERELEEKKRKREQ